MTSCETYLRTLLAQGNWLSIADFMKIVLHDPIHGYYTQKQAIGRHNDFITAPEVSQLFGETLALWLLNSWERLGCPSSFVLLELGPGRGTLLKDLLRITSQKKDFLDAMQLHLVDINPILMEAQKNALLPHQPKWFNSLDSALENSRNLPIFIIANEFLDTFPIHQYTYTSEGWKERGVNLSAEGNFQFSLCLETLNQSLEDFPSHAQQGDIYETCPDASQIIQKIGDYLSKHHGSALLIDYGYIEGHGDTLQALYRHQYSSPLDHLGEADLTAHIDFGRLRDALKLFPSLFKNISTQGDFLKNSGIELWGQKLFQKASTAQKETMIQGFKRLVDPHQMGSLFKVLEVSTAC